jgi:hypothetical protein
MSEAMRDVNSLKKVVKASEGGRIRRAAGLSDKVEPPDPADGGPPRRGQVRSFRPC